MQPTELDIYMFSDSNLMLRTAYHTNVPAGMDMSQLYCGGCRTLLMYTRGATSVRCSCCHTVNLASGTVIFCLLLLLDKGSWY